MGVAILCLECVFGARRARPCGSVRSAGVHVYVRAAASKGDEQLAWLAGPLGPASSICVGDPGFAWIASVLSPDLQTHAPAVPHRRPRLSDKAAPAPERLSPACGSRARDREKSKGISRHRETRPAASSTVCFSRSLGGSVCLRNGGPPFRHEGTTDAATCARLSSSTSSSSPSSSRAPPGHHHARAVHTVGARAQPRPA